MRNVHLYSYVIFCIVVCVDSSHFMRTSVPDWCGGVYIVRVSLSLLYMFSSLKFESRRWK